MAYISIKLKVHLLKQQPLIRARLKIEKNTVEESRNIV